MRGLLGAFVAQLGIISYRSVRIERRAPLPAEFLAAFVVYGALSVLAGPAPRTAGVTGWGLVIATGLNIVDPTNPLQASPPLGLISNTAGPGGRRVVTVPPVPGRTSFGETIEP